MLKRIATLILFLSMPFYTMAADYQEGKQYTKINEQMSLTPEVREYFSFYCPHCFRFEPLLEDIKAQLPESLPFMRNHVNFLRTASPEIQDLLSKAIVVAQQLNMEKKLVNALFNYIHVQHASFSSAKDIRNVFVLQGVDGEQFDKLMNSFTVTGLAMKMKKNQEYLVEKQVLTGVPTIIINNKYRINLPELDKADPATDLKNLILYLSKLS
jgi:protein dithiol oxidoreductase (disulfide-forming)